MVETTFDCASLARRHQPMGDGKGGPVRLSVDPDSVSSSRHITQPRENRIHEQR